MGVKGSKGGATAAGLIRGVAPLAFAAVGAMWALVVWLSGYVSLGSVLAAGLFPLADWLLHPARRSTVTLIVDVALAAFIIWKHRANIRRLLAGTENRFGRRASSATTIR